MPRKKAETTTEKVEGRVEGVSFTDEDERIRAEAREKALSLYDERVYGTNKLSRMTGLILKCRQMNPGVRERTFSCGAELLGWLDAYFVAVQREQEDGANVIADVETMADFCGVTRETLIRWARGEANREFIAPVQLAFNNIASGKKQMAYNDKVNGLVYVQDMQNNHGYQSNNKSTEINLNVRTGRDLPPLEQLNRQMALLDSK